MCVLTSVSMCTTVAALLCDCFYANPECTSPDSASPDAIQTSDMSTVIFTDIVHSIIFKKTIHQFNPWCHFSQVCVSYLLRKYFYSTALRSVKSSTEPLSVINDLGQRQVMATLNYTLPSHTSMLEHDWCCVSMRIYVVFLQDISYSKYISP